MSELYRERNDLDAATQLLVRSKELGELAGLPQNPYRWRVALARIEEAQGDLERALELLDEAERLYVSDFFPNVRPVAAVKTRVWLRQGRVGDALSWAREQGLSTKDDLSYLHEFEHITLARLLLARYESDRAESSLYEALALLARLLHAAEEGERTGRVIEILVLQALAHRAHGDTPAALMPLERALTLAQPEGYVRMFVDEGPPMAALLRVAATRSIVPAYASELLAAFQSQDAMSADRFLVPTSPVQPVIEPLSQRELEVLRLFNSDLSGPEIARELVVALSTVRTHTKSIYGKLGVTSRHAAVKRAGELGLI
jgi:LuxR family maltose regulon positive regulatory protein